MQTQSGIDRSPAVAPGPRPLPVIGNVLRFGPDKNILFHFIDLWQEYGDVAHVKMGALHVYVVAEPENVHHVLVKNVNNYIKGSGYTGFRLLVGQGLVTSDGDLWWRQRRLMQPSFTPKSIVNYFDMMVETTERTLARWHPAPVLPTGAVDGEPGLIMDDEMTRLTMSIISKAIFGVDLGEESGEVSAAFHDAFAFVTARTMSAFTLPLAVPLPTHRHFLRSLSVIDDFVARQIEKGRRQENDTLLSILLRTRDEETGAAMSEKQVRDEVVTLFLAGFETTARSLTWGWYLLARHPHVMEQLSAEVDAVLAGRRPTVDDLFHLNYTRRVVDETLRLYPPTALLGRQIVEDDVIAGYRVPAGGIVMLAPYLTHRLPNIWPDPERFDPDRFLADAVAQRPKSAYIPFISGPRVCLGNNFALMEMTLAFAMAAQRYRLVATDNQEIGVAFRGSTCPLQPLRLRLVSRF